jgi:hypothetical protein
MSLLLLFAGAGTKPTPIVTLPDLGGAGEADEWHPRIKKPRHDFHREDEEMLDFIIMWTLLH